MYVTVKNLSIHPTSDNVILEVYYPSFSTESGSTRLADREVLGC